MSVLSKTATGIELPANSEIAGQTKTIGGLAFDWIIMILGMIFLSGLYIDGWAHNHGEVDTSFFTPWHAFFYSGFGLIGLMLVGTMFIHYVRGYRGQALLPKGYFLTALGALLFAAGGIGDLIWHELFGIEQGLEALVSPSHLLLGMGMGFVLTGPLRAAWHRTGLAGNWKTLGPAILSLTALMSVMTFLMMYIHPILSFTGRARMYSASGRMPQIAGFVGLIVMAALLVAPILLLIYRWQLPLGALTLIWGVNTVGMVILNWKPSNAFAFIGAMLVAGLILDGVAYYIRPTHTRPGAFHLFAFLAPVILFTAYFVTLIFTDGTAWSIHLWTGSVFMSSAAMWLLSHLMLPPALPKGEITGS